MLRLFRITDAFNVNKRQLAVRLSTTISALGVWEGNGAWSSPGRAGVTASPCDRAAVWGIGANPACSDVPAYGPGSGAGGRGGRGGGGGLGLGLGTSAALVVTRCIATSGWKA
jgi:hypothetical protein